MRAQSECADVIDHITSFIVSHGHNGCKYSIREEKGDILFCAYYWDYDDSGKTVDINDIAVSREDMDELGKLCDKYLIDANLEGNDKSSDDSLNTGVEIVWKSGKRFQTAIAKWEINDNKAELVFITQVLSFFDGLCKRFDGCYYERPARPFVEGNIISFSYSEGRGGRWPESYELRNDLGELLFDADVYTDVLNDNDKACACEEIQLRDEQVSSDTMEKFNSVCEGLRLSEQQIRAASVTKTYIEPPWKENPAVFDVERYRAIGSGSEDGVAPSFTAVWDNGASFTMRVLPDDLTVALRKFFRSLVTQIQANPEEKAPQGKVVSVRLSCANISKMEREGGAAPKDRGESRYGYSFHLWEEDGKFNFDSHCLFRDLYNGNDMERELKLEKTPATQEDMEVLREICEKNTFAKKWHSRYAKKIENKKLAFGRQGYMERDRLEVIWENGARLDMKLYIEKRYLAVLELKSYFSKLAGRLDQSLPASGKIVSFRLKGEYSSQYDGKGRFIPNMRANVRPGADLPMGRGAPMMRLGTQSGESQSPSRKDADYLLKYEYWMREIGGEVLFNAYESDHPRISSRSSSLKEPIPSIDNTHLETLRALCKKHAFAEKIQHYHAQRWDDFCMSDFFLTDCNRNPNYDFFEIVWENGAHCEGTELSTEFRDFFSETVNSILPRDKAIGSWTCPRGHAGNTGKYCAKCGAPVPYIS